MFALTSFATLLALMATGLRPPYPFIVEQFETIESVVDADRVVYRLYHPAPNSTERVPLIVWFHGLGECGNNNLDQLVWLELLLQQRPTDALAERNRGARDSTGRRFPCAVLAVQSPQGWAARQTSDRRSGNGARRDVGVRTQPSETQQLSTLLNAEQHAHSQVPLAQVDRALADVIARYAIDEDRIYLAGISDGAAACWDYSARHPRRFAAMLPMGTSRIVASPASIPPTWAFQGTSDGAVHVSQLKQLQRAARAGGCELRFSLIDNGQHDCWTTALLDYPTIRWMLQQRIGRDRTRQNRWGVACLLLIILLATTAAMRAFRRV